MDRIWILNHHANTNGHRHYELAREFAKRGIEVTVFCSSFNHHKNDGYKYTSRIITEEINEKVKFIWFKTVPSYSGNGIRRVMNMIDYYMKVRKYAPKLWKEHGKPDVVIGSSVHPFAWEAAYWVKKRTKALFVAEVRDFWPISLIESSRLSRYNPATILFKNIENRSYKNADLYVSTFKQGYKRICDEKGFPRERYEWIPNGISVDSIERGLNSEAAKLPKELESFLSEHWCCVYAGSVARNECVNIMVDAMQIVRSKGYDIYFAVIGEGNYKNELQELIERQDIKYIRCFGKISRIQVAAALKKGKVCLAASYKKPMSRYGNSMNKIVDYLYSEVPAVFMTESDNAVADSGAGLITGMDINEYADTIIKVYKMSEEEAYEMGQKGISKVLETYDYKVIAEKYLSFISKFGKR